MAGLPMHCKESVHRARSYCQGSEYSSVVQESFVAAGIVMRARKVTSKALGKAGLLRRAISSFGPRRPSKASLKASRPKMPVSQALAELPTGVQSPSDSEDNPTHGIIIVNETQHDGCVGSCVE
eukprot:203906-Amphidinium_carterae.1